MIRLAGLLLVPLLTAAPSGAQSRQVGAGSASSVTSRSELPRAAIDSAVRDALRSSGIPGIALVVVRRDSTLLAAGYGRRGVEADAPVDERTVFAIGSITEAFTATALGMLVDQGRLAWDDPVHRRLPGFQLRDRWVTERATVRDLLAMRVGLPAADSLLWTVATADEPLVRLRATEVGRFRATQGEAGNTSDALAGRLLGHVSGERWDTFVAERLLGPLGMSATTTHPDQARTRGNAATPHRVRDGRVTAVALDEVPVPVYPAAGLHSNAVDVGRWLRFHLGRTRAGDATLVSDSVLAEMHEPQVLLGRHYYPLRETLRPAGYGLGWAVYRYGGAQVLEHGGAWSGHTSLAVLVPERDVGFAILTNMGIARAVPANDTLRLRLLDLLLGAAGRAADAPAPRSSPAAPPHRRVGRGPRR